MVSAFAHTDERDDLRDLMERFATNREHANGLLPSLIEEHRGEWLAVYGDRIVVTVASPSAILDQVPEALRPTAVFRFIDEEPKALLL